MSDTQNNPLLFVENSQETMRLTSDNHWWQLCDHDWKYCITCAGWPCGEPKKVKSYCEKCSDDFARQFKTGDVVEAQGLLVGTVISFLAGVCAGMLIAL